MLTNKLLRLEKSVGHQRFFLRGGGNSTTQTMVEIFCILGLKSQCSQGKWGER